MDWFHVKVSLGLCLLSFCRTTTTDLQHDRAKKFFVKKQICFANPIKSNKLQPRLEKGEQEILVKLLIVMFRL